MAQICSNRVKSATLFHLVVIQGHHESEEQYNKDSNKQKKEKKK